MAPVQSKLRFSSPERSDSGTDDITVQDEGPRHKRSRVTYTVTVFFGEPMSANLRCQRFQSFADNAPRTTSKWTLNVPLDLENGAYRAVLETSSEDEFNIAKSTIEKMASQVVMPFSKVVYSGESPNEVGLATTKAFVSAGTKDIKMRCESACGKIFGCYPCGKVVFEFPDSMPLAEKMVVIRRQHLKWLKQQNNTTLEWSVLREIDYCYKHERTIDKITRFTLESTLKEKLVYFAMDKYSLHLPYKQVRSMIKCSATTDIMNTIYELHHQWLDRQVDIDPSTFTRFESLYIHDCFLDNDTRKLLHGLLWYKHYVVWQSKENRRLRKKYPFWEDNNGLVDVYSASSDSEDSHESTL